MAKHLIFCADGTWNGPEQDDNHDLQPDPTNVFKLFLGLEGSLSIESLRNADEQEKELQDEGRTVQIAKYLHGVGDSRNPIVKLMGGAFGAGIISRIVRGYTFLSRNYEAGDAIVLVGFSRGAYTARALGGLIVSQGLLAKSLTEDKTAAYRWGAKAWYRYRQADHQEGVLPRLAELAADLPAFLSTKEIQDQDLLPVPTIQAVAVWDTVGALGIPDYCQDRRIDAFQFADTQLSPKVLNGFHAIALDEQRGDFTPTLWDRRAGIVQQVFPGAHADVGGGYPTANRESELADIALGWMAANLRTVGVRIILPPFQPFSPNPLGTAHKPWQHPPFTLPEMVVVPRDFSNTKATNGIEEHKSVQERIAGGAVVAEPQEAPQLYRPLNRPT